VRRRNDADIVEYNAPRQTGFFNLRAEKNGEGKDYPFAVGPDTRESVLTPVTQSAMNKAVNRLGARLVSTWDDIGPFFKRARQDQHLWWWLISLAIVLALLEIYLSRRMIRSFVDSSKLADRKPVLEFSRQAETADAGKNL
jgi:hypothetical protein